MSRHDIVDPEGLLPPRGFSHGVMAASGRAIYIAGQTGHDAGGNLASGLVEQFARACRSVSQVIEAAGGEPTDLVMLTIYTTDVEGYRRNLGPIGEAYREVFGKHYPAMALIGVTELFDPRAVVELVGVAVIPDRPAPGQP